MHKHQHDWNKIRSQRHWAGGYTSYRYGTIAIRETHGSVEARSRITLPGQKPQPPIFNKDKRRHVIDTLSAAMRDWRYSPFQFEGVTRAHIRSALCAAGYGWQRSDAEALSILAEVLKGYPRPSWNEGQPSYTASVVVCRGCGGGLGEYEIANGIRFCCEECRKMSQSKASGLSLGFIERAPTKCANPKCRNVFFPKDPYQKFCGRSCYLEGRVMVLPPRECAICSQEFQPKHSSALYCSEKCHNRGRDRIRKERRHEAREERSCNFCRSFYVPKRSDMKYCSQACAKKASDYRRRSPISAQPTDPASPVGRLFDAA